MENKINIAELLKDCPSGMELNCTIYQDVYFDYVGKLNVIHCYIQHEAHKEPIILNQYGTYNSHTKSKCVIFPKGRTTWEGFVPPYQFKDGDILTTDLGSIFILKEPNESVFYYSCYIALNDVSRIVKNYTQFCIKEGCRLATEEEKQKLFDAIKANGYKWNAETKTLEKLIVPKFKVGDRIKYKNGRDKNGVKEGIILSITDDTYDVAVTNDMGIFIPIADEYNWELVPNKFDIHSLVPFESRVLVRDTEGEKWKPAIWGYYDIDHIEGYPYETVGGNCFSLCIPYKGNEHLCGTTNDCDDFYRTW